MAFKRDGPTEYEQHGWNFDINLVNWAAVSTMRWQPPFAYDTSLFLNAILLYVFASNFIRAFVVESFVLRPPTFCLSILLRGVQRLSLTIHGIASMENISSFSRSFLVYTPCPHPCYTARQISSETCLFLPTWHA
jgi:hypothetical protein